MKKWIKFLIVFVVLIILGVSGYLIFNNSKVDKSSNDNNELKLELKDLSIKKGESYKITDFVVSCNGECIYSYDDSFSIVDEVGTYDVVIIAKDKNREIKKSAKLVILDDIQETQEVNDEQDNSEIDTSNLNNQNQSNNVDNTKKEETKQEETSIVPKKEETTSKKEDTLVVPKKEDTPVVTKSEETVPKKEDTPVVSKKEETKQEDTSVVPKKEDTTPKKEEVPEVKSVIKVDTVKETSSNNTYKYGTTIINTVTITYDVYSDGSKKEVNRSTNVSYDYSTFNAKTNDLKSEASSLVSSNSDKLNQVVNYTNQYRSEAGVSALKYDSSLSLAATIRALEMGWANSFSHTRPDGRSCFTVLNDLGISYYTSGENIAWGYGSAKTVSEGWKKSSGHYANMINSDFTKIGVGYVSVNGNSYWVQLFG